jgi:hypothetical protein
MPGDSTLRPIRRFAVAERNIMARDKEEENHTGIRKAVNQTQHQGFQRLKLFSQTLLKFLGSS